MEEYMKETFKKMKRRDMGSKYGLMAENLKVSGKTEIYTKGPSPEEMGQKLKENLMISSQ